ncbi:hypothetical protein BOX15_Mlig034094g2 [Macrostomum lignano]|uniref:DUF3421 domain-containing protein n=2 Tax=Macrostomum lignano TaxID=282301 RepID=A0A267E679_9PLAT|nr:hypothetical protein BOX15_Mlig034094g2 [Macrostomum lignano]
MAWTQLENKCKSTCTLLSRSRGRFAFRHQFSFLRLSPHSKMYGNQPYPQPGAQPPPYGGGGGSGKPAQVCLSWVPASNGQVPPRAVQVGTQRDGSPVYVSRARHGNELIPAKLVQGHGHVCLPYGGKEHLVQQYEVLCDSGMPCFGCGWAWAPCQGFNVPPNAIIGGHTDRNEPLYIGKGFVNGDAAAGKVYSPHQCAYFSWGGAEHSSKQFEILVAM